MKNFTNSVTRLIGQNIIFTTLLLFLATLTTVRAYGDNIVARTLNNNQSLSIYSHRCTLSLKTSTASRITVSCSKFNKTRFQLRPAKHSYLTPNQSAVIKARACSLVVNKNSAGLIRIRCTSPSTPTVTATPTSTPTLTATSTPTPTTTPTSTQTPIPLITLGGTISGLSGSVVLQNNGGDNLTSTSNGSFTFPTGLPTGSPYSVTVLTQPATQTCIVTNGSGTAGFSNITNVNVTCVDNSTTLSASLSLLALSVTGITESGVSGTPSSGLPRVITITNVGSNTAQNLSVSFPTFPSGTTSSTTCGATLAASSSCTITITPGANATSNGTAACTNGTAPVPGIVSVGGDNSNTVTTNVVVLGYGCIFQGGHVYAFDDTNPSSNSVGGKVITVVDQAAPFPSGLAWSSNGVSSTDDSSDILPGISETSTTATASPTYSLAQTTFNSTYSNTGTFPFPSSGSFPSCNGGTDGSCNSSNILTLYNTYVTNFGVGGSPYSLSAGPTNVNFYAAGLCTQTINGFSDWYLPAVCEMGPAANGSGCSVNQNVVGSLSMLLGDPSAGTPSTSCAAGANCLVGFYWSSTQLSSNPQSQAWYQYFSSAGGSVHSGALKFSPMGVRCSRTISYS
jgi:hypothetical protein